MLSVRAPCVRGATVGCTGTGRSTRRGPGTRPEGEASRNVRLALDSKSRKAKKWLGQHSMVDDEVTTRTVEIASIKPGDVVLEVGPGTGVLTYELLLKGAFVVAVEKDKDMVDITRERFAEAENLEVLQHDIMKWPLEKNIQETLQRRGQDDAEQRGIPPRAKVVANLPYNITTEFLQRILPMGHLFSTAVLMLQDDAAKRLISAAPGSSDYRKMNVLVKYFSEPTYELFVDRRKYLPPPKFHGAVVKFDLRRPEELPHVCSVSAFLSLLDSSFALKRKMLRSSLTPLHSAAGVESALIGLGKPPTSRPEDLSLEDFIALTNTLHNQSSTT